jgi:hypothetical protein
MCNVHNRVLMFCGSFGFGSNLAKIDGARYSSSRASLFVSASRIMPLLIGLSLLLARIINIAEDECLPSGEL